MIFGTFYNGKTSGKQACALRIDSEDFVHLDGAEFEPCPYTQITISSRLGDTARFIQLPGGARFETNNNEAIDNLIRRLQKKQPLFVAYHWESKLKYIVLAALLMAGTMFGLVKYGIPWASKEIAYRLPAHFSVMLANESLSKLDKTYFSASELSSERQQDLQATFYRHQPKNSDFSFSLHFRKSDLIGANAFALPDGSVVMTDELVRLAKQDEEILAILLHEIGHVVHRHSLRRAIESAGLYVIFSWATGDVEIASTLILALPAIIMHANYSQNHEWEADTYSLQQMQAHNIDPIHFANIMASLEASHNAATRKQKGDTDADETLAETNQESEQQQVSRIMDFVSSHPPTTERIERFISASDRWAKP